MKSLILTRKMFNVIFLLLCCFCYASTKTLTEREIRNNFNDVQTGMGVLLRELLVVMDENERLASNLNKTTAEFKNLKETNTKVESTIRSLKKTMKSSKITIITAQKDLFHNLTKEQKKMKEELSKFVTNKYAFLAWMVYKLETQNKEQERKILNLKIQNSKQKTKTIQLEEEINLMQKKLEGCEESVKKNKENMKKTMHVMGELKKSMVSLIKKLGYESTLDDDTKQANPSDTSGSTNEGAAKSNNKITRLRHKRRSRKDNMPVTPENNITKKHMKKKPKYSTTDVPIESTSFDYIDQVNKANKTVVLSREYLRKTNIGASQHHRRVHNYDASKNNIVVKQGSQSKVKKVNKTK